MITRRTFLAGAGATAAAAALSTESEAQRKPNVVIILTDDQGWGDVDIRETVLMQTPNLRALAMGGCQFERFYVSPVCAPTRASLLTGRYHLRTGVNGVTHREETMRAEEVTIAEILRDNGYATGCFGKWHNGAHYPNHPNGQGFDEFFGFCAGHWNNYFDTTVEHNGTSVKTEGYINDVFTEKAIDFIAENRDRPFLCYVPYNTPHSPFQVPDEYFDKYRAVLDSDELACVYGMIENIDDNVGRILNALEENGLTEDTIVMFLGDNGPNTERFNGGLRARKGSTYDGGTRNNLFLRYPRKVMPDRGSYVNAAHIDLLPTILEFAGIPLPSELAIDGLSIAGLCDGSQDDFPMRTIFSHWAGRGAAHYGKYSYVVERNSEGLYDLDHDPGQEKDISEERPELAAKLKAEYKAWYQDVTKNGLEPPPAHIGHPEMPTVTLPAPEAALAGGVAFKGEKGWANDWITNWTSTECTAAWDVHNVRQGAYEVTLLYTCSEANVGSTMQVRIGDKVLNAELTVAHDPEPIPSPDRVPRKEVYEKIWARLTMGTIRLAEGPAPLTVRALEIAGDAALDLKAVEVKRVAT